MQGRTIKTTTMVAVIATLLSSALAGGALVSSAYAASDQNTANDITVVDSSTTGAQVNGRSFTAYKLAGYENATFKDDGSKVTGYNLKSDLDDAVLKDAIKQVVTDNNAVKDAYKEFVAIDGASIKFIGDDSGLSPIQFIATHFYGDSPDVYGNDHANKADMRQLADILKGKGLTAYGDAVTGADGKVTFDLGDADLGMYLIVEGQHTPNGETVSRAMIIGSPFKNGDKYVTTLEGKTADDTDDITLGEIQLKADKVTVDKKVVGDNKLVTVDSVKTFQIDTNVPEYKTTYQDWTNPVFKIHDNPSDTIQVSEKGDFTDIQNFKVEANTGADGAYEVIDATKYDLTPDATTANDANDFIVSLKTPADYSGKKIRVTYDGTVKSLADDMKNETNIEFSNDPYAEDSVDTTPSDTEQLYEADLDLNKVKSAPGHKEGDALEKLDGAKFKVTVGDANTVVKFSKDAGGNFVVDANGTDADGNPDKDDSIVTVDGGLAHFKGLAADTDANGTTYTFTETKAPTGYILGDKPVSFKLTVKPVFTDNKLTDVTYSIDAGDYGNFLDLSAISRDADNPTNGTLNKSVYTASATVENTTNQKEFAKTGGQILQYAAVAGLAFVLGGTALAISKKRRASLTIA